MAGLEEFYTQPHRGGELNDLDQSWRNQRRPITVPQFEADESFFGGYKASQPRLINLNKREEVDAVDGAASADHYAGLGIGVAGLIAESLVAHPLVVLRRSCQVSSSTIRHHRTPMTLLPVVIRLYRSQGIPSLWKGFGSSLIVRGLNLTAEDLVSKLTPWPKEINFPASPKMIGQHLLLKAVSIAVVTPFFSVSLIESVQSDIASESPGLLDIFREGFSRIFVGGGPRAFPMWYLIPATVTIGLTHYIVCSSVKFITEKIMRTTFRQKQETCGAVSKRDGDEIPGQAQYRERVSSIIGHMVADILLFPAETILHRLHLQGSRTIIDNLDTGREVLPVTTGYLGVSDCANEIITTEGFAGFFRGFGALIIQYALQFAIIRLSTLSIREIARFIKEDSAGDLVPKSIMPGLTTPPPPTATTPSGTAFVERQVSAPAAVSSPSESLGYSPRHASRFDHDPRSASRFNDPFATSSSASPISSDPFARPASRTLNSFASEEKNFFNESNVGRRRRLDPDF